jgi:ankyrin repeat protein
MLHRLLLPALLLCTLSFGSWAQGVDRFFSAVSRDDESAVVAMALRGQDLNQLRQGEHVLVMAAREGSIKTALFLLSQAGVKVDVPNAQGETALMMAAIKGHMPLVKRLIERGAAINKPGWTALHYAASYPEPLARDIVALLLEHHAYIDTESPNGTTPLMMAARYGHISAAKLLLEEGADVQAKNKLGLTALDFAQSASRPDMAEAIVQKVRASQPKGTW